jgi:hypothetical protein
MPVDQITEPEVVADEPAKEPAADEGRADDADVEDAGTDDASKSDPVDPTLDATPPEGLDKTDWQALDKKQRDSFLRMSSDKSRRIQELEAERDRAAQELDRRQRVVEEVALRGSPRPEVKPEPLPEFQDMNQLVGFVEERAAKRVDQIVNQRLETYKRTKAYEDRWESGWNTVAEADSSAAYYRKLAYNELRDPQSPYLKKYNGTNEAEVIRDTVEGIRNIFEKATKEREQKIIADTKRKISSTTEKPSRSFSPSKDPKTQTKQDLIAEMNAAKIGES